MKKVLIIGAGITGLSAGWKLAERGYQVEIVDAQPYLGGMAATFRHKDYLLDYGPHKIFTILTHVMAEINELFKDTPLLEVKKRSRIRLAGKYLNYPVGVADIFKGLGLLTGMKCGISYALSLISPRSGKPADEQSYEDWVVERYGRAIYDLILRPYAAKIWGDPRTLSKELAESRIASPNLLEMLKQLILGKRANARVINADSFYYPRGGSADLCEKMAARIKARGGVIRLGAAVKSIETGDAGAVKTVVFSDATKEELGAGDILINTAPLQLLPALLVPPIPEPAAAACRRLKNRRLVLLFVALKKDRLLEDNWLFFPEGRYPFNRVFEQKAFNPEMGPAGRTVLCAELTCAENDPLWTASDAEVFAAARPHLEEAGLLGAEIAEFFTRRIETAYPVYTIGYRRDLDAAMAAVDAYHNLYSVGRQGGFSYTGMADSMDIGFSTAEYIAGHAKKGADWPAVSRRFYNYVVID